jgi:hypothetical protein
MCDPKSARMKLDAPPPKNYGSLLQQSRMLARNTTWDDSSSSEEDEEEEKPNLAPTLYTLQSVAAMRDALEKIKPPVERVRERDIPVSSASGVDPALFKMIYNLGFDAGLDKRDPIPPCGVCEERRRKNRIAAAQQRKRLREEEEAQ